MTEKLCKVCGKIPTNHPSGTCIMCMTSGALPPQASQREMQGEGKTKKEAVMAVPIDRQCKVEGCEKFRVDDGFCLRHFNAAHGVQKRLAKEKICIGCKASYKPTSNAQERCPECKEKHLTKKQSSKSKKRGSAARPDNKKITPVIPAQAGIQKEKELDARLQSSGMTEGNGQYIISIDFTAYPNLHQKLLKLADEDFRNPGQQLLSMLHNTLKEAEAGI